MADRRNPNANDIRRNRMPLSVYVSVDLQVLYTGDRGPSALPCLLSCMDPDLHSLLYQACPSPTVVEIRLYPRTLHTALLRLLMVEATSRQSCCRAMYGGLRQTHHS